MRSAFLLFFLILSFQSFSISNPDTLNLSQAEKILKALGDSVLKGSSDSVRNLNNLELNELLGKILQKSESFSYGFDSVKAISTCKSPDEKLRFYNWVQPVLETNSYKVFGYLQVYNSKLKTVKVIELKDGEHDNYESAKKKLTRDNWYGAIYYNIILKKNKKQAVYTLLGWRGVSNKTTKKIIDVLTFENDIPVFGAKIFSASNNFLPTGGENQKKMRIIFEYNAQAVMSLNYDKKKDWIVFDRIAPAKANLKGMEEFYGPVFVYDAFKWEKGIWKGIADVDAKNKTDDIPKNKPVLKKDLRNLKQE